VDNCVLTTLFLTELSTSAKILGKMGASCSVSSHLARADGAITDVQTKKKLHPPLIWGMSDESNSMHFVDLRILKVLKRIIKGKFCKSFPLTRRRRKSFPFKEAPHAN
jgi:hypothetical protein